MLKNKYTFHMNKNKYDYKSLKFSSAYVTDSRLMGVMVVHALWKEKDTGLHQFFYIDCTETGIERYTSHDIHDIASVTATQQQHIGGLGSAKKSLSEREFRLLMCKWRRFNMERGLPLPEGIEEYGFIFEPEEAADSIEMEQLFKKTCCHVGSDLQVVNYFLMRCIGFDREGALYLTNLTEKEALSPNSPVPVHLYEHYPKATFCRNEITEEKRYADGSISYLSETIIETGGRYFALFSKVVVNNLKVIGFEHCSSFPISHFEAATMLSKPEHVAVYDIMLSDADLMDNIGEFTLGLNTIMTKRHNGLLFMAYRDNNDHVDSAVFMLSNDLKGAYFLTSCGQLVVMSNSPHRLGALKRKLTHGPLASYLLPIDNYRFERPVLFDFMNSPFDDFEEYLDYFWE